MLGIDVYDGDGKVDWAAVKKSGKSFAIVRATEGASVKDTAFAQHWKAMKVNGIIRGAYHFFHPLTSDPVIQAREFLKTVGKLEPGDLPPVLDIEKTDGADSKTIISKMKLWLAEVEKAIAQQTGKKLKPIIYTYPNFWIDTLGNPSEFADYPLWIAHYGVEVPLMPSTWGEKNWMIHQYKDDADDVPGVSGQADLNRFHPLEKGASGVRVKELQQLLKNLKKPELDPGNVDGDFGMKTCNALIAFQKTKNLLADGIMGPSTWVSLLWA
jgi:lysozyme